MLYLFSLLSCCMLGMHVQSLSQPSITELGDFYSPDILINSTYTSSMKVTRRILAKHNLNPMAEDSFFLNTSVKTYIIYHDDSSKINALNYHLEHPQWTELVELNRSSRLFDSAIYTRAFPQHIQSWVTMKYKYVGMFSYNVPSLHAPANFLLNTFKLYWTLLKDYDVVPFFYDPNVIGHPLMNQAVQCHGDGFRVAWDLLLTKMGYSIDYIRSMDNLEGFHRSSFVCKPQFMIALIDFMTKASTIASTDPEVVNALNVDSKDGAAVMSIALTLFNRTYYGLDPYIFERLPVFFFHSIKASIFNPYEESEKLLSKTVKAYIVYHKAESSKNLAFEFHSKHREWTEPLLQHLNSRLFESAVYSGFFPTLVNSWVKMNYKYVGLFSYKAPYYMRGYGNSLADLYDLHELMMKDYDVIPFIYDPGVFGQKMMAQAVSRHGDVFRQAWDLLLTKMGFSIEYIRSMDNVDGFHRNSFICKTHLMLALVQFMTKASQIAAKDPEVMKALDFDANYGLCVEEVALRLFNKTYYALDPFIFERLPVFFFHSIKASIYNPHEE